MKADPTSTRDPASINRSPPAGNDCPPEYLLKGSVAPDGERFYVEPGRPSYAGTVPVECFTAGGDARAAGYRERRN